LRHRLSSAARHTSKSSPEKCSNEHLTSHLAIRLIYRHLDYALSISLAIGLIVLKDFEWLVWWRHHLDGRSSGHGSASRKHERGGGNRRHICFPHVEVPPQY
jgi:hypothetical protein